MKKNITIYNNICITLCVRFSVWFVLTTEIFLNFNTEKCLSYKVEYGLSPAEHLSTNVNRDGEERLTVKKKKKIIYQLSRLKQKNLNFKYDIDNFYFRNDMMSILVFYREYSTTHLLLIN